MPNAPAAFWFKLAGSRSPLEPPFLLHETLHGRANVKRARPAVPQFAAMLGWPQVYLRGMGISASLYQLSGKYRHGSRLRSRRWQDWR
jgi:hypothetical protein